jgi:hypothetical protein
MMMSENEGSLTKFGDIGGVDPAVAAILKEGSRRRVEARLPLGERKKRVRERQKNKARQGRRAAYDLTPALIETVKGIAEKHSVPASQIAALLLELGLGELERGEVDINDFKVPSQSPRYEWTLDLEGMKR